MPHQSYPYGAYPYPLRRRTLHFPPLWPALIKVYRHNGDDVVHDHDFIEIAIILGGSGIHQSVHGDHPVQENDVFIVRPGAWHCYHNCRGLEVFNCIFGGDFLQRELGFVANNPLLNYLLRTGPLADDRQGILSFRLAEEERSGSRERIQALMKIDRKDDPQSRIEWLGHFVLLLHHLTGSLGGTHQARVVERSRAHEVVRDCIELLEKQPAHDWTLQELANKLYISPSYLLRRFREDVGIPPLTYLARHRAERAAHLLLKTDKSIAAVGAKVGWDNPSYFSQRFKAHFGMTAGEYRDRFSRIEPREGHPKSVELR